MTNEGTFVPPLLFVTCMAALAQLQLPVLGLGYRPVMTNDCSASFLQLLLVT
jgi:hypothetical protein